MVGVWAIGGVIGLLVMTIPLSMIISEPLRRYIEHQLNTHLQGYTVRLGRLYLRPWSLTIDLYDVSIVQNANPEPPIIFIPRVRSGIHGRALLSARVVSDVLVEPPKVHINLQQIRKRRQMMYLSRSEAGKRLFKPSALLRSISFRSSMLR